MNEVKAVKVAEFIVPLLPGQYKFRLRENGEASFYFVCPCGLCNKDGEGGPDCLHVVSDISKKKNDNRCWVWDGNEDSPTLTPSIMSPCWHGYLTAGIFKSC